MPRGCPTALLAGLVLLAGPARGDWNSDEAYLRRLEKRVGPRGHLHTRAVKRGLQVIVAFGMRRYGLFLCCGAHVVDPKVQGRSAACSLRMRHHGRPPTGVHKRRHRAAVQHAGMRYARFMDGLKKAGVTLDRSAVGGSTALRDVE